MSLSNLYLDYNVETAPEGHKHFRDDWINVPCPHCSGSSGYHLGFNTEQNYYFCWRCGHHRIITTLVALLNVNKSEARNLSREYRLRSIGATNISTSSNHIKINVKPFKLPSAVVPLHKAHSRYLERRNFDSDQLVKKWGVQGTSPTSMLDKIAYKYRILTPIYWDDKMVSFQTRDYTNKQEKKYMACPQARELVHHKHLLYGDQNKWGDVGICVEGTFDVWRLGGNSFSTLGIGYTPEQVRLISKIFKKVIIIFDPEVQAKAQAKKLQEELQFRGVKAINYTQLEMDPADLSQDDADHLLKELKVQKI